MKLLIFALLLFFTYAATAQADTTTYGYIDSVTYKKPLIAPAFPGGKTSWERFIQKNLGYPEDAKRNKVEGIVVLEFTIGLNGRVSDVNVIQSLYPSLDAEAIKLIERSLWHPAEMMGYHVKYRSRQTIQFSL